jgi:hypothetical protein
VTYFQEWIIEVRDSEGRLDPEAEKTKRKEHPFLFSKKTFRIDKLCWYASYGQGRSNPSGPMQLTEFMNSIGVSHRQKTW